MDFRPYIGSRIREHYGSEAGRAHSISEYGKDRSGTVTYNFNRFGFRGSELNPNAKKVIYVSGCSHTFGTGNSQASTWPAPFARDYALHHGLNSKEISLLNFAEGATSNRCISRTLIDQCRVHKPDLAIAHFSEVGRTEFLMPPGLWTGWVPNSESRSVAAVGPWQNAGWLKRQVWLLRDFRGEERHAAKTILDWARSYYARTYRGHRAAYETLQDMLIFQYFCQAHEIEFMMCCVDYQKLVAALDNLAVRILWEMIDHARLVDFAISDSSTRVDTAADGAHPGPESHRLFADKLWNSYLELQSSSNASL